MQNILALQEMSGAPAVEHGDASATWSSLSLFLCRSDVSVAVC